MFSEQLVVNVLMCEMMTHRSESGRPSDSAVFVKLH